MQEVDYEKDCTGLSPDLSQGEKFVFLLLFVMASFGLGMTILVIVRSLI